MERKIGETFRFEGKTLQVKEIEEHTCEGCFFKDKCLRAIVNKEAGECFDRVDKKNVIFVEAPEPASQEETKLNLCEILQYCPQGETFWSPMLNDVKFLDIDDECQMIIVETVEGHFTWEINHDGTISIDSVTSPEIMLYPSREQRDWAKVKYEKKKERFNPQTLKPFDRVLCQPDNFSKWQCNLFSHIHPDYKNLDYPVHGMTNTFMYCIPYNDETKHLLDTTDEAPEFYRYWED